MAFQTRDVLEAMQRDAGLKLHHLKVDGGAAANNLLLQFQADVLGVAVRRPVVSETTALGAAYLAGLAVGYWKDTDDVVNNWALDREFTPAMPAADTRRAVRPVAESGRALAGLGRARGLRCGPSCWRPRPRSRSSPGPAAVADDFACTEVLGVSVTGDWFGAGFEKGLDDGRWQVRWRSKAFVELWADPRQRPVGAARAIALHAAIGRSRPRDLHRRQLGMEDREEWESRLEAALATIRAKRPGASAASSS
jgi:hypothetical protein